MGDRLKQPYKVKCYEANQNVTKMENIIDRLEEPFSPGLMRVFDELEAFMGPGADYVQDVSHRRIGHQLPESPPDSGSENPYSPSEQVPQAIPVAQTVLSADYMLVHDPTPVTHDMLHQNENYIYEELKSDNVNQEILRTNLNDVVVLEDTSIVDIGRTGMRHEMIQEPYRYQSMRVELMEEQDILMNQQLVSLGQEAITPVYTNLQEGGGKKRKLSEDMNSPVKCEPERLSPHQNANVSSRPLPAPSVDGSETGDDGSFQCIRFASFQPNSWHVLYDQNLKPLPPPSYIVGADKGFNFSNSDDAFVCQKKNHFQVTSQVQIQGEPYYVKTTDGYKKINSFYLHFYGVKAEAPNQTIKVEQSQSDRSKKPFHPVPVEVRREGTKITVGRLHFAETTCNNMRKKGKPNPDQRHFQLVVALHAHTAQSDFPVVAQASERIIVRASNPGQFESECPESWWQRGVLENSVHFNGKVGINTDRPDESCVINGNLKVMGQIVHPSDVRAKHNIEELDTAQQLRNVQSIRVVKFNYDQSFAQHSGLLGFNPTSSTPHSDTGVIAQELRQVLPEAVKEAGDIQLPNGDTIDKFLVVNKDRIFMENLGAVKELCKVTGKLESRIDHLERINKKLCKINILQRRDSAKSSISNDSRFSRLSTTNSSKSFYSDNISIEHIRDIARNIRRQECCQKLSHNSPKYHRKQCRSCKEYGTYSKYGKFYNNNKTNGVKYTNKNEENAKIDSCTNTSEPYGAAKSPDFNYESEKRDTCIWLRNVEPESNFSCGNTKLVFCCRKDRYDDSNELISNKFLQIVITVLIFIMAVCLVVMSALYFKEHQELILLNEKLRPHRNYDIHHQYGKFSMPNSLHGHTSTTAHDTGYHQNSIQKGKAGSQQTIPKKPTKDKGPHKTTQEYITTAGLMTSENHVIPTISTQTMSTLKAPAAKRRNSNPYVEAHHLTPPHDLDQVEQADVKPKAFVRTSPPVGRPASGCPLDNTVPSEDDEDCPTPCCLDSRQTFDNSDPLERNQQIREVRNSTPYFFPSRKNLDNPQIPPTKEKSINIAEPIVLLERNGSDVIYNNKNNSINNIQEEVNMAESNFVDSSKAIMEGNNNESRRFRRQLNDATKSSEDKTNYQLTDKSDETDCDTIVFAINSKSFSNDSIFVEKVCSAEVLNLTYNIPVSKYMRDAHIDIIFKSSKIKIYELCSSYCKSTHVVGCQTDKDVAKPFPENSNVFRLSIECKIDRILTIKASEENGKPKPCQDSPLNPEQYRPLVQYNIHVYRDCHN